MKFEKIAKWTRSCVSVVVFFSVQINEKLQSGQEIAFNVVLSLCKVNSTMLINVIGYHHTLTSVTIVGEIVG